MNIGNFYRTILLSLIVATSAGLAAASSTECTGDYFTADDVQNLSPQPRPAKEFRTSQRAAAKDDAVAQRSLAVSYDAGYLTSPCAEQAIRWYTRAADSGDKFAQKALDRHQLFAALLDGPECLGSNCSQAATNRSVTLQARGSHFYAPVTINGRTLEGVIDTGASLVSMSAETAKYFGIDYANGTNGKFLTANGVTTAKQIALPSISVAGISVHNIDVSVGESKHPILIGMAFLKYVRMNAEGGTLTLSR